MSAGDSNVAQFMQALAAKRGAFALGVQSMPEIIREVLERQSFARTLDQIDALPETGASE